MRCPKCNIELSPNARTCPECGTTYGALHNFFDKIASIEKVLLALFLGTMIIVVLIQIFLRNLFYSGISGGDSLVRHLLLWVGFVGAGLATRDGAHIRIDAASRLLPRKLKHYIGIMTDIFSVTVCCFLVFASYQFVSVECEAHGKLPFLGIPVWIIQIIIPMGYLIIGLRFASRGIEKITRGVKEE